LRGGRELKHSKRRYQSITFKELLERENRKREGVPTARKTSSGEKRMGINGRKENFSGFKAIVANSRANKGESKRL